MWFEDLPYEQNSELLSEKNIKQEVIVIIVEFGNSIVCTIRSLSNLNNELAIKELIFKMFLKT